MRSIKQILEDSTFKLIVTYQIFILITIILLIVIYMLIDKIR